MTELLSRIRDWFRPRERPRPQAVTPADWLAVDDRRHGDQVGQWAEPSGSLNQRSAALAVAMYRGLADSNDDIVVSPFSLRVALAMALGGARGETAAELRRLLGLSDGDTDVHEALGRLCRDLQAFGGDGSLGIANSLWIANAHPLTEEFEGLSSAHYGSEIHSVDLASPATIAVMNRWVADHTFGRITDLISGLDADSRLVLINALAFRGKWATPFLPSATLDDFFTPADGRPRSVAMMHGLMRVGYAERRDLQAVELEYQGGRLSMLIVLPAAEAGLSRLEHGLSAETLAALDAELRVREVHVSLPRFKISADQSLVPLLQSLGVRRSFDRDSADFSGINGRRPPDPEALFVSAILQKAVVDVNEAGTEAVAATAVVMMRCSALMRPVRPVIPVFRADHPFLFAIRDRASGEILFMGRVAGSRFEKLEGPREGDEFNSDVPEFLRLPRGGRKTRGVTGGG